MADCSMHGPHTNVASLFPRRDSECIDEDRFCLKLIDSRHRCIRPKIEIARHLCAQSLLEAAI